jgi:dihydropteroate synthase-like protein
LLGAGNVTELVDADSIGVNALLACIASELDISMLLTTEVSNKTKFSVRELATAAKMASLAKARRTPPKDLGVDLLMLKDKRSLDTPRSCLRLQGAKVVAAREPPRFKLDPRGFFRIALDRQGGEVLALHFAEGRKSPDIVIRGKNAKEICDVALKLGLISRLDHAAYLGCELEKAEIALKTGKGYAQDLPLFEETCTA